MALIKTRRDLLRASGALAALCGLGRSMGAQAARLPVLDRLDNQLYLQNMSLHAHYFPGQVGGSKLQMMVHGPRRFLFHSYKNGHGEWVGRCLDITDPLKATVVGDELYEGYQAQVAYNKTIGKWILITSSTAMEPQIDMTRGAGVTAKGLRGIRIYDVTDPSRARLLSEWSCDQGDPSREIQQGTGTHRNFYTGGKYAYLDTAPDNSFSNYEYARANGVQVIDILDPSRPKFVSNLWIPGQRNGEDAAHKKWPFAGNGRSIPSHHGGFVVPENVEDGGRYGFGAWSVLGVRVHDLRDIRRPKEVGAWDSPQPAGGGFKFHTVDVTRLDRGIALVSPEMLSTECGDVWYDSFVLDVRDFSKIKSTATLPVPVPPADAGYQSFCQKRGRFGPHNAPHQKAPGTAHPNFTCYTYFNGGLQCYDLTDPTRPAISAYFVPPQAGTLDQPKSYGRDTDGVFVEWDRRLIWASTSSGIYLLSTPSLGSPDFAPLEVATWTLPALRRHWPTA